MSELVRIQNLTIRYDNQMALKAVDLDIARGEILGVIGESGSGKTTLAFALAGLLPAPAQLSGHIDWRDGQPQLGRDIGFVFQDPASSFDPLMTVGGQLVETIRAHQKTSRKNAQERAISLLDRVHIPDPHNSFSRYPHQFSGGQKQRIAIALAICANPRVLIADEPTSALDTIVQRDIISLLQALVRENRMTLIFITHDIALASGLADRIAVFRAGQLVETGTATQIIGHPQREYTAKLLAAIPRLEQV